jgi:hypothetical protein
MQADDFVVRLNARSATAKLIEAKPVEAKANLPPAGPAPTPAGAPMARLRRA